MCHEKPSVTAKDVITEAQSLEGVERMLPRILKVPKSHRINSRYNNKATP